MNKLPTPLEKAIQIWEDYESGKTKFYSELHECPLCMIHSKCNNCILQNCMEEWHIAREQQNFHPMVDLLKSKQKEYEGQERYIVDYAYKHLKRYIFHPGVPKKEEEYRELRIPIWP